MQTISGGRVAKWEECDLRLRMKLKIRAKIKLEDNVGR